MDLEITSFNAARWNELCVLLAAQASRNCGSAHDRYQRLFSELVDERLRAIPEVHHAVALEVASRWDYQPPAERAQAQQELHEGTPT
ncbi:MAG: hypothetical protein JNK17_07865 [Hydrogenophaga sp.]|nr:hypothetical protein [Hydrogenophaga sp.]